MASAAASEMRVGTAWLLIVAEAVIGCLVMMALYSAIALIPALGAEFTVDTNSAAWAVTAFGLAYATSLPVFGALSDRLGRKQVFVPGLVLLAAATILVAFSPSFGAFIALRVMQGIAAATYVPVVLAYLRETVPHRLAPTAIAGFSLGLLVAGTLGQVLGNEIATALGWRWVYGLLAGAYLAAALVSWFLPKTSPQAGAASAGLLARRMLALLGKRDLIRAYGAAAVLLLAFTAMYTGLQHGHGQGAMQVDILALRLIDTPGMAVCLLAGFLAQRYGAGRIAAIGLFVAAVGLIVEGAIEGPGMLILGSLVFVIGIALAFPSILECVAELAGDARGAAMALAGFALFSGASLGPLLAGALIGQGFGTLSLALAVLLLAGAAALTFEPRRP